MNRRQKIIVSVVGIFIVLLALVGLTYAYFLTRVIGNGETKSISVTTANLELVYDNGSSSLIQNGTLISPNSDESVGIKTFTVTNNGNGRVDNYGVFLEEFAVKYANDTVIDGVEISAGTPTSLASPSDMKLDIVCKAYDTEEYEADPTNAESTDCTDMDVLYTTLPTSNDMLLSNGIDVGVTHEYTVTLTYLETGLDQSDDMNKTIEGLIQIYGLNDVIDIEGEVTEYSTGDYVQLNSEPKKSQIVDGKYKFIGVTPGAHRIRLMNSNNETKVDTTISIAKGKTTELNGTNVIVTNTTQTLTANILKDKVYLKSIDDKLNEIGSYTNLADTSSSDWKSDYALTHSKGADIYEKPYHFVSNVIPVKAGDVIRIKGRIDDTSPNTYLALKAYNNESGSVDSEIFAARILNSTTGTAGVKNAVTITADPLDSEIKTFEYNFAYTREGVQNTYAIKEGVQYYFRVSGKISGPEENIIITVNEEIDGATKYSPRWFALGDSITEGYIGITNDDATTGSRLSRQDAWVYKLAKEYGYAYTNYGVGGSGYAHIKSGTDMLNAKGQVQTIDFSKTDFVTLAFGVNDWKGKANLGSMSDDINTVDAMIPNMRYVINKIFEANPKCKIFVITPLNCAMLGTAETNWGLNYAGVNASGPGLQQIYEIEKEVVDSYNGRVHLIDMTHSSIITNENIKTVLPDLTHPSIELHTLMADEIGEYISQYIK